MHPTQYMAVGFVALIAIGIAVYLIWGMVTFAVDLAKNQLDAPKWGGSWSAAHVTRQVTGALGWFAAIVLLLLGVMWGVGLAVHGLFGWG